MAPINPAQRRSEPIVHVLPDTRYFEDIWPGMTLRDWSAYAESERRNEELGSILNRVMRVPLDGKLFYSPGGAALVERARERLRLSPEEWKHATDAATNKWSRAAVVSPGTAVLGLGQVDENLHGMLMAGAAAPIMIGKSAYFLWTAGVNAEPITIETPFQFTEIEMIVDAMVMDAIKILEQSSIRLNKKRIAELKARLLETVEQKFFKDLRDNEDPFWKRKEVSFSKKTRDEFAAFVSKQIIRFTARTASGDLRKNISDRMTDSAGNLNGRLRARIFAETVRKLANNYGFINVEDARGADLPIIMGMLESMQLETAIWSDDKQGTGVITAAALLSWAEKTGRLKQDAFDPTRPIEEQKPLEGVRVIIFGAGAGAMGVYDELINMGVRHEDILVTDRGAKKDDSGVPYVIHEERDDVTDDPFKMRMRQGIKKGTTVEEFAKTADVVLNLGDVKTVTHDTVWLGRINKSLRANPLMGYMTNPAPGVKPEDLHLVRNDAYYASGNQLYENTVNNFTAFGFIGLGALLAGAQYINKEMTVAAAWAIHRVAQMGPTEERKKKLLADDNPEQTEYGQHWIVPDPTDLRLLEEQTVAVAMAAARSGVSIYLGADPTQAALKEFEIFVREEIEQRKDAIREMRAQAFEAALKHYKEKFPDRFAPFYLEDDKFPVFYINPIIEAKHVMDLRGKVGLEPERLEPFMEQGELKPKALSEVLEQLKAQANDSKLLEWEKKAAYKELIIIKNIALISPSLGFVLALRKVQSWAKLISQGRKFDSIFGKFGVKDAVVNLIPKAASDIEELEKVIMRLKGGSTPPSAPSASSSPGDPPVSGPAPAPARGRSASGQVRLTGGTPSGVRLVSSVDGGEDVDVGPRRQTRPTRQPVRAPRHGLWAPGALPRASQIPVFIAP